MTRTAVGYPEPEPQRAGLRLFQTTRAASHTTVHFDSRSSWTHTPPTPGAVSASTTTITWKARI